MHELLGYFRRRRRSDVSDFTDDDDDVDDVDGCVARPVVQIEIVRNSGTMPHEEVRVSKTQRRARFQVRCFRPSPSLRQLG